MKWCPVCCEHVNTTKSLHARNKTRVVHKCRVIVSPSPHVLCWEKQKAWDTVLTKHYIGNHLIFKVIVGPSTQGLEISLIWNVCKSEIVNMKMAKCRQTTTPGLTTREQHNVGQRYRICMYSIRYIWHTQVQCMRSKCTGGLVVKWLIHLAKY